VARPKLEFTLSRSDKSDTFVLLAPYLDYLLNVRISDFIQVDIEVKIHFLYQAHIFLTGCLLRFNLKSYWAFSV